MNVMSTHQLLRQLHPHIQAPARVVVTVSDAHFGDLRHTGGTMPAPRWAIPEISRPGAFDRSGNVRAGRRAYVTSKLGGVHLVHEWARRLPDGIDIVSYNPSLVVGTGLTRETGGAFPFLMSKVIPLLTVTPSWIPRSPRARSSPTPSSASPPPRPVLTSTGRRPRRPPPSPTTPTANAPSGIGWNRFRRHPTEVAKSAYDARPC